MNNRAYTLIELIVVMSLISTLLLFAVPSLKNTLAAHPVRSEVRKLADCVGEIRSRAVREQIDYVLHVDLDKGRFRVCRASDPAGLQQSGIKTWKLPDGIRIAGVQSGSGAMRKAGEATILFSGQGYTQPAVIHLLRDDCAMSLTLRPFLSEPEIRDEPVEDRK